MRRRTAREAVEQYRVRLHEQEGHALRDQLADWAESVGSAAGEAFPVLPEVITDRKAEAWEPLIAVADACWRYLVGACACCVCGGCCGY